VGKKAVNVSVNSKETRGNHERMIRKFIKKTKKAKIIEQVRERRYYKKPSIKKKEKIKRAARLRKREQQKILKANQKRYRKK
jgi:ribosomal protein S21|tara:strand:- start:1047 stop:1292 length:246 start_codon:yes stop_codon:yes gene_type:complete